MKLKPRNATKVLTSPSITAPETRKNKRTDERELLLGFIDERGDQQHLVTNKLLFLYAAGDNVEGQMPDGLDRLRHHKFLIHVNKENQAVGLDIIPARVYRSNVIPTKQIGVDVVSLVWHLDGMVCRVIQRPANTKPAHIISLMKALEKMAVAGGKLVVGAKIPDVGVITAVGLDTIDVRLNSGRTGGRPVFGDPTGESDD